MSEYFKGYAEVYFIAYQIMESQRDAGLPSNEGICFERMEKDGD